MPGTPYTSDVYISYAGNDAGDAYENSRDYIVRKICDGLQEHGIRAREYKRDIQYKDSIEQFMNDIADADYIVMLISKKYLESEYCMYEAIEILAKNKRGLKERIFPVVLDDAQIFETDKHLEYVLYWINKCDILNQKIKGIDPQKIQSLHAKAIIYREISENIDSLLQELNKMKQLNNRLIAENGYQEIVQALLQKIKQDNQAALPQQQGVSIHATAQSAGFSQGLPVMNINMDVASMSKGLNDVISTMMQQFNATVQDSESAKKEYLNVKFDELAGEGGLTPLTRDFILQVRTRKDLYESYRRSLIISALSLGLIRKFNDDKARMLLDFIADGEATLAERALVGLILGLLGRADYLGDDLLMRLKKLQQDEDVQDCLVIIHALLGNKGQLDQITTNLQQIDLSKFEFFSRPQHWFMPFYENNPVVKEHVQHKKLAKALTGSLILAGLDSSKYAIALMAPELEQQYINNLIEILASEENYLKLLYSSNQRNLFVRQIEVSKYLYEFYIFGKFNHYPALVQLVEDETNMRNALPVTVCMHPHTVSIRKAGDLLLQKNYLQAVEAVRPILEDEPNNIKALLITGSSYYLEGRYADAIPFYEKAIARGADQGVILAELGDAYFFTKQYASAIKAYESLLAIQNNPTALLLTGQCYVLQENPDYDKALQCHLQLYVTEPGNYQNLLSLGDCYYLKQAPEYEQAYRYYMEAFTANPDNLPLVKMLHETVLKLNYDIAPPEQRIALYEKFIALDPENANAYVMLALIKQQVSPPDNDGALALFHQALKILPGNSYILTRIAESCINQQPPDHAAAQNYLEKALAAEPGNIEALMHMGWVKLITGDTTSAKTYFEQCLESEYSNAAYQNLGHIALVQHDTDAAKAYYKKSIAAWNNNDAFRETSLDDFRYLEPFGIAKDDFVSVIQEVLDKKDF